MVAEDTKDNQKKNYYKYVLLSKYDLWLINFVYEYI